jgi:hypothetical protein
MIKRIGIVLAGTAFCVGVAGAQRARPIELGIDAGVAIGLGDNSVTVVSIPAQAFRVGFFIDDRISLEPKFGLTTVSGEGDTFTTYAAELGLLYHFYRTRMRMEPVGYPPLSAFYVRPFAGLVGASGGGNSTTNGLLGAGLGMKVPLISRLASRFEANFAHIFGDDSSNQIGLLAGLSFFTR